MSHPTIAALRSLVDSRFPTCLRKPCGGVPSGIPALDAALGGALPSGRLTELVSSQPSTGGQLVLSRLLITTRQARQRVALVDAADGFAPESVPADALSHLVWVRPRSLSESLTATDILIRDGNYAVVVLDLRGLSERDLLNTPKAIWHRLQRAAESRPSAVLVQTTRDLVPAVPWRLALRTAKGLSCQRIIQDQIVEKLTIELVRGHAGLSEELAG